MGDFDECFWERVLNESTLGTKVSGRSISVDWYTGYTSVAYYTLVCFICMFVFIGTHFWKRSLMKQGYLDMSLFFWKLSILCYAFVAVSTGITRVAMFFGALHNASELNCIVAMALHWGKDFFEAKGKKHRKYLLIITGLLYFCAEFMLAMTLPIKEGFTIIVIMGVICDGTTFILWTAVWLRGITRIWPFLAMLCHMIYIVLFFINCAIRPWGRVAGLGLNVFAMLFASFRSKKQVT